MNLARTIIRMISAICLVLVASSLPLAAQQQPVPNDLIILPNAQPAAPQWAPQIAPQFDTTITPPPTPPAPQEPPAQKPAKLASRIHLLALLTEAGEEIDRGVVWRIFQSGALASDIPLLKKTLTTAKASALLQPGSYIINAAFGRANLTRKIVVEPGTNRIERFVLNAGGLRLHPLLAGGQAAPPGSVVFDIFSDELNRFGNRTRVITGAKPNVIIRLNSGIYHIVTTYGDANAKVRADVTVEAGKLTEAKVTHAAARIAFKLVARPGGEAMADTSWQLTNAKGVIVKRSQGAIPSHILAAGDYVISATYRDKVYSNSFSVTAGRDEQIEVIMQ